MGAAAADLIDVDAELARHPARRRRGGRDRQFGRGGLGGRARATADVDDLVPAWAAAPRPSLGRLVPRPFGTVGGRRFRARASRALSSGAALSG